MYIVQELNPPYESYQTSPLVVRRWCDDCTSILLRCVAKIPGASQSHDTQTLYPIHAPRAYGLASDEWTHPSFQNSMYSLIEKKQCTRRPPPQ